MLLIVVNMVLVLMMSILSNKIALTLRGNLISLKENIVINISYQFYQYMMIQ